jgi:pyruvate,water dikinase
VVAALSFSRQESLGRSVGSKIATGPVRVIPNASELAGFQQGEVLVTDKTDPDWEPIMKKAAAIVTIAAAARAMPRLSAASWACRQLSGPNTRLPHLATAGR